jgi:hypothetical protein
MVITGQVKAEPAVLGEPAATVVVATAAPVTAATLVGPRAMATLARAALVVKAVRGVLMRQGILERHRKFR